MYKNCTFLFSQNTQNPLLVFDYVITNFVFISMIIHHYFIYNWKALKLTHFDLVAVFVVAYCSTHNLKRNFFGNKPKSFSFFFFFLENNLYTFTHVSEQIRINKYTKEKKNNNNRSKRDETLFLLLLLFHCNYHFFYTKNNKKRTGFIFTTSFCLLLIQMQSYD